MTLPRKFIKESTYFISKRITIAPTGQNEIAWGFNPRNIKQILASWKKTKDPQTVFPAGTYAMRIYNGVKCSPG